MIRRNPRPRRHAKVLVFVVVMLPVLVSVVALALDGGRLMDARQRVRATADAAALAAGAQLYNNFATYHGLDLDGSALVAAKTASAANGYTVDGTNVTLTLNVPPTSGPYASKSGYAEVLLNAKLPGCFSAVFNQGTLNVSARSVAAGRHRSNAVLLLQRSGSKTFQFSSTADVTVVNGDIVVNSTSANAFWANGTGLITADNIVVSGGDKVTSTVNAAIYTGIQPTADPLKDLPTPNVSDYPVQSSSMLKITSSAGATLQPGVYTGGIQIDTTGDVTLNPGVYYMNGGGFQIKNAGTVTGAGVLIFAGQGSSSGPGPKPPKPSGILIDGTANVTLSPPSDGSWLGVTLFQDRTITAPVNVGGTGVMKITGVVYAASAPTTVQNSGSLTDNTLGGGYVCSTMQVAGDAAVRIDCTATTPPKSPVLRLVD